MDSQLTGAALDTLFYFAIFFLVMAFIGAHLSLPFKMLGNAMKTPMDQVQGENLGERLYMTLNQWGVVTFLDGALMIIAIIILVFLKFSWKKMQS